VVIDSKEIHDDSESIASDESEEDMIGIERFFYTFVSPLLLKVGS
jgi:hypothetical protein